MNHTFLADLPHHLFWHFRDLGFEWAWLLYKSLSLRWSFLLLLHLAAIPVRGRLYHILSTYLGDKLLAVFVDYRLMWVVFFLFTRVHVFLDQVNLFLFFHEYVFISLMQRARVRDLNFFPLLLLGLGQLVAERCKLFLHDVLGSPGRVIV